MSVNPKTNICGRNSPQGPRNFKHYGQKQTIQMQGASLSIPPKGGAGLVSNRRKWDPSSERENWNPRGPILSCCFRIRRAIWKSTRQQWHSAGVVGNDIRRRARACRANMRIDGLFPCHKWDMGGSLPHKVSKGLLFPLLRQKGKMHR